MKLIEVHNLEKTYNTDNESPPLTVLSDATFSVEKGEFLSIMGPSGSGKSTLLHILGFLDRASSGRYLFDGKESQEYSDQESAYVRNERMGFVFQTFNLLPNISVLENVKLPLLYSSVEESKWNTHAQEAIESVGLSHRLEHQPSQLSGGERQRVAIARALINKPDIIFADEPTGNLDSRSGEQVLKIFEKLHGRGHTIILVTHETYTAGYAQRIIRLLDGKIVSDGKITGSVKHRHLIK